MKSYLSIFITLVLFTGAANSATPISEEKAWTETYTVSETAPHLKISNIWGGVRVRTGKSGEITVSVTEVRSAPDRALFDMSLERINLDIEADNNGVSILVGDREERWRRMDRCKGCRVDYQFDVVVPADAVVDVGTVMDGLVDVKGVEGVVSASNVNGRIHVDDINNCDSISSVNGRVEIGFTRAPVRDCSIETINGDITLDVPANTSLDVTMDLFNGDIRSDFPVDPLSLPATVEHVTKDGQNQYRIQQLSGIRIGAGGPTYTIASMNGDVRIQKN
jgi:hypothetical protein